MSLETNKKIKMAVILILFCISLSACSIKLKHYIQPFELLIGKEAIPEIDPKSNGASTTHPTINK